MPRYVAFLGNINVGDNQLKMAELRGAAGNLRSLPRLVDKMN